MFCYTHTTYPRHATPHHIHIHIDTTSHYADHGALGPWTRFDAHTIHQFTTKRMNSRTSQ